MFGWRITKYNPANRDSHGVYLKNEWTSSSDRGKFFDGKLLTNEEYNMVEDAYINAILLFMKSLSIDSLTVTFLGKHASIKEKIRDPFMEHAFDTIKNEQAISQVCIPIIAQLVLREFVWCKLESENMYVHFGYDYYMYIGSKEICDTVLVGIKESGLYVESFISPYGEIR